ncbi:unnamed protein product [Allacma fusca]|uniref:Uncharacterized protein n=1 Tax=Allacma fusca TaxID=39272 RepID=A0A8J2K4M8_9HEXA|nr:unnamed protein product [Allacma fusca]
MDVLWKFYKDFGIQSGIEYSPIFKLSLKTLKQALRDCLENLMSTCTQVLNARKRCQIFPLVSKAVCNAIGVLCAFSYNGELIYDCVQVPPDDGDVPDVVLIKSARFGAGLKEDKDEPSDGESEFVEYCRFINNKNSRPAESSRENSDVMDASVDNRDEDTTQEESGIDLGLENNVEDQLRQANAVEPAENLVQIPPVPVQPVTLRTEQQEVVEPDPPRDVVVATRTYVAEPMQIKEYLALQFGRFKEAQISAINLLKEPCGQKQFDELVSSEYYRMSDRFHDPDYYSRSFPSFVLFVHANTEIGMAKIPSADWRTDVKVKIPQGLVATLSDSALSLESVVRSAEKVSKSRRNPTTTDLEKIDLRYVCFMHNFPLKVLVSMFNFSPQTLDRHYQRCHGYFNSWHHCPVEEDEDGERCKFENIQLSKVTDHLKNIHGITNFPNQVQKSSAEVNQWYTKEDPDRVRSKMALLANISDQLPSYTDNNTEQQPSCSRPEGTGRNLRNRTSTPPSQGDYIPQP